MSDKLNNLLRERFNDHQVDVPPGAWEHVSGQLAAAASGESFRESLQEKFNGHEIEVDPSVWTNISGQLGHVATTGISFGTGLLAASVGAVVMTTAFLIWNAQEIPAPLDVPTKPQIVVAEVPSPVITETSKTVTMEVPKPAQAKEPVHTQTEQAVSPPASGEPAPDKVVVPTVEAPVPQSEKIAERVTEDPVAPPSAEASGKTQAPEKPADTQPTAVAPSAIAPVPTTKTDPQDVRVQENEPFTTGGTDPEPAIDPFQKAIDPNILIPSAITPNGDGLNDKWKVIAPDCSKIEVVITSAGSGSVVYRSSNLNEGWDGRLPNGNIAEEGSYVYVVLLTDREGRSLKPKQGVVTLYR